MSELAFNFADMIMEVRMFSTIASDFLDFSAGSVLAEYVRQLELIQGYKPRGFASWTISTDRPIKTGISEGTYESGNRRGGRRVIASISSHWQISCPDEGTKKGAVQRRFHLGGLASTTVKFFSIDESGEQSLLSIWQADVGDDASPGCHFHVQIQREDDEMPYPKTFPVPRFPSLLTSPLAVAEFVISELFQVEWSRHAVSKTANLQTWSRIQRDRMEKLLSWQRDVVTQAQGSPWPYLKSQKPGLELFA